MAEWNEGKKAFTAGEDLAAHRRVKQDSTAEQVIYADAVDDAIGVTANAVSSGELVTVIAANFPGTVKVTAKTAFSLAAVLYGASDGMVDDAVTGPVQYVALEAATALNDVVEAMPLTNTLYGSIGGLNESGVASIGVPISSSNIRAHGVYADDAGTALTAGWYMAEFHQFTIASAQVALANISVFGSVGEVHLNASIQPGGNHAGVFAYAEVQTGKTLTMGSNISFSGLLAGIDLPSGAILGAGVMAPIAAGGNLGGTHTGKVVGLHFTNPSAGSYDYFMQIGGLGTDTTGFTDATAHGSTESGRLKIRSGSNVKYLHLFDD